MLALGTATAVLASLFVMVPAVAPDPLANLLAPRAEASEMPSARLSLTSDDAQASGNQGSISADGSAAVFVSSSSAFGNGNLDQVYLRDLATGETTLVSSGLDGAPGNGSSGAPVVANGGAVVAFESSANNLVAGDTNNLRDVFVWYRATNEIVLVSQYQGTQGDKASTTPSITPDGTKVVFRSDSSTLAPDDTDSRNPNVYVRSLPDGPLVVVTRHSYPVGLTHYMENDQFFSVSLSQQAISDDGQWVTFLASRGGGALQSAPCTGTYQVRDIFVVPADGSDIDAVMGPSDGCNGLEPVISGGGDWIIARNRAGTGYWKIPRAGGSASEVGLPHADAGFTPAVSSHDGNRLAFQTNASNLVANDTNGLSDVYVLDGTSSVRRVSLTDSGADPNGSSTRPRMSSDGRRVVYTSSASNIVAGDTNGSADVFLRGLSRPIFTLDQLAAMRGPLQTAFYASDPVNVFTGNFTDVWNDLALPPAAGPISWSRTYNSLEPPAGILGVGWATTLDVSLTETADGVLFRDQHGREALFIDEGAAYRRPESTDAELVAVAAGWELRWRSGGAWRFGADGELLELVGWDGITATVTRDSSDRIEAIATSTGFEMNVSYNDAGLADALTLSDGRTLGFGYDTAGFLTSITHVDGGVEEIAVDELGRILEITDTAGRRVVTNTYDADGRVIEQLSPDGDTVTFFYDDDNFHTVVTDTHSGDITLYVHDGEGRMVSVTDAAGGTIERDYDEWGNITAFVDRRSGIYARDFDGAGNLLSSTNPDGATVTNTWDELNRLVSTTDAQGATTTYIYVGDSRIPATITGPNGSVTTVESSGGLVERVVDGDGMETAFAYDEAHNLLAWTDGLGNTTTSTYDAAGRMLTETSPLGHTTAFTYDVAGRMLTETDPEGGVTTYTYSNAGDLTSVIDPAGATTTYQYGPSGRLVSETDPEGHVTTYDYDESGDLVAVTEPGDATTTYVYGPLARLMKVVSPEGVETHFGYDADGHRTTTVLGPDPADESRVTTSVFDEAGRVVEHLGPVGAVGAEGAAVRSRSTTTYDDAGRVIETTVGDGDDVVRKWRRYDDIGRLQFEIVDLDGDGAYHDPTSTDPAERDPADRVVEYTYTAAGRRHQMIEAPTGVEVFDWVDGDQSAKRVTTFHYDDAGRLVSVTDPDDGVSTSTFDAAGRMVRADAAGDTYVRWEMDTAGRPVAQFAPSPTGVGESVETWAYDPAGRVVEHAEPHDPAQSVSAPRSTFGYHPSGRLAWVRDPRQDLWGDRVEVRFDYDGRGNLVEQRAWSNDDAADPDVWTEVIETWAWDLDNRLVAHTRPGGGTTSYAYDPATGWLSSVTHPSERVQTMQYWPDGRVRQQTWSMPGVDGHVVVERWYDSLGRQTRIADPTGATNYRWDRNGALVEVAGPQETTRFGYDQHGHRTMVGYPWGFDAHFELDALGRPVALTQGGVERAGWGYDADGRVVAETIGPDGEGGTASWVWPDNGAHRPLEYRQQLAENPLRVYELGWDHSGRLVEQDLNGAVETFAYDPAGQLVERQRGDEVWSWTYNTRGLITHTASSTDAGDEARHTTFNADGQPVDGTSHWVNGWVVPTSFDHDPDGRLVEARLATSPVYSADYDARGLPTEITTHWDGQARTTGRVYDGDGYLVSVDPGSGAQPISWDRSRADGPLLATHQGGARAGLVSYLHGPTGAVGVHYGAVWLGGVNRDPHASSLNHYFLDGYDPWGNPEGVTAPARFGLGYRGELTIDGVVHLRNRDYHPGLHAFTSPDPLDGVHGTPTVANRYHYGDNDPLNRVDPLGLRAEDSVLWGDAKPTTLTFQFTPEDRHRWLGEIQIAGFIPQAETTMTPFSGPGPRFFTGDNREFTEAGDFINPDRNRFFASIDFGSGRGFVQVNPTCRAKESGFWVGGGCSSALPIVWGEFTGRNPFSSGYKRNHFVLQRNESGNIYRFKWSVVQSDLGLGQDIGRPRADGYIDINFSTERSTAGVSWRGDCFPSIEVMRVGGGTSEVVGRVRDAGAYAMIGVGTNFYNLIGSC